MLPNCPEIFSLGVVEAMRSRGLGAQLVAQLERVVRARSNLPNPQVGLGVAFTNPRARELYGRLGYLSAGLDPYVDHRTWLDDTGEWHEERELCEFLVKDL
jgi:GNAT superfamily N-acetyltransferase